MRVAILGLFLSVFAAVASPQRQPSPEITKLVKEFSGSWSIAIRVEPNESLPKGGEGHGEETWRPGPAGLSLIEEYHSTGDEGEQSGLGVAWWENDARRYRITWCDSNNSAGCAVMKHGAQWEANHLVFMDEAENSGKKLIFKEVFSDIMENSFTQALYQGESSNNLKLLLKIRATRKATPHAEQLDVFLSQSHLSQAQSLKMPGPAVQNSMLGTWLLALKYAPGTERPNGASGQATEVWWAGPGGYSVIEEYYQNDANEHIDEFIPNWWDSQAQGQRFLFCANTVPYGCQLSKNVAKWEGDRNLYTEEREGGGKKMTVQEIFEDISANSFTQVLKEGESGKALNPTITMQAKKVTRTSTTDTRSVSAGFRPGQTFRDCPVCPEMVVIPSGSFVMGAAPNEPGSSEIELPQHRVTVQQFAAGKFDVTRGQWAEFVSSTKREATAGCSYSGFPKEKENIASWRNLGFTQDDTHPVVCITWEDAQDYVQWLSQRAARKYRLLTEAEWEYAARAGTTTAYPWGSTANHEHANYGPDKGFGHGLAIGRDRWVYTSPVGSFPPNPFGLYDMHGNVLQWVQDCLAAPYAGVPTDGSPYQTDVELKLSGDMAELNGRSCWYRILRGGDWGDPPEEIRSAFRNFGPTDQAPEKIKKLFGYLRSAGVGFRVARTLE